MKIITKYELLDDEGAIVEPAEGPTSALDGYRVVIEFEGNKSEYRIDYEEQEDLEDWLACSNEWHRVKSDSVKKNATITIYNVAWDETSKPYMKAYVWERSES